MKIEFATPDGMKAWLSDVVDGSKYDLYYDNMTLYAVKNVSTSPRIHGYVRRVDESAVLSSFETGRVTFLESFEWDHRRGGRSADE